MTRTDLHRPAAMNPTAYRVLAYACVFKEESLETGRDETVCELEPTSDEWEALGSPTASTWSEHRPGQCDHCGAHLIHNCIVLHIATGDIVTVGRDCVRRFFNEEWSLLEQKGETRARRARNTARFLDVYSDAAPALEWATSGDGRGNKFAADLMEKAIVKGWEYTATQVETLVNIFQRATAPIQYKAGRQTVEGVIVKVAVILDENATGRWGKVYKAKVTVQTPSGLKVWGSLPTGAIDILPGIESQLKGRPVSFVGTLQPKDAGFALYSRPTNWVMGDLPEAPAVEVPAPPVGPVFPAYPPDDAGSRVWRTFLRENRVDRHEPLFAAYDAACLHFVLLEEAREQQEEEAARQAVAA